MHKHLHPVVTQALVVAAAAVVAACGSSSTGHASDTATASLQPTTSRSGQEDSIMRIIDDLPETS